MQRPTILNIQQPLETSAREIWHRIEVVLPKMRCRIYKDHCQEWSSRSRQVPEDSTSIGRAGEGGITHAVLHCIETTSRITDIEKAGNSALAAIASSHGTVFYTEYLVAVTPLIGVYHLTW